MTFARLQILALFAALTMFACSNATSPDDATPAAAEVTSGDGEVVPGGGEGASGSGEVAPGEGEVTTPSGLRITEVMAGSGPSPKPTDVVLVHYHGTFPDGKVFDSSVDRGQPARFPLNRVIPCWTEGLQLMKQGGKSRLVCPPGIAYGARGAPPRIPANATLIFDVELIGIGE